ncbi:hypothetical protein OHS70_02985 [Streptomyces sp. NBC_00390]|uniref:hypothetical protein n=1 Tax=Streptomyces sp. NBC_00390 TaxID=2975736 RepID=UPI002E2330E3
MIGVGARTGLRTGLIDRVGNPLLGIAALWRLVHRPGPTPRNAMLLPLPWYTRPEQVLRYRMTTMHDWMLELCAYCTDEVREPAYRPAKDSGPRSASPWPPDSPPCSRRCRSPGP